MAQFQVSAAWGKPSYNAGETLTATVTGVYLSDGGVTTSTVGPFLIPIKSSSGVESTVSVPAVEVTTTTPGSAEAVFIDTTRAITDSSGRKWSVSADRKSITATA